MLLFTLLLELVRPGLAIQVRHNSSNHRHHGPPITIIKEIIQISHTVLHLRHSQQHHLPGMEKVEKGNISRTAHRLSVELNFLSAFLFPTTQPRLFLPTILSSFSSFDAFLALMHICLYIHIWEEIC